ncbi:hypothetical protein DES38_104230 [Streptohalobacillus salinus]|uniref:Uncharacterized protein n=1 Tax=Streptohalobacillus salinus TaxID=621096 RepID=A0A2V3WHK0_9BACI|nr:hypothetical protein [Streptohalobacillus salinus]PXW91795.1 hypothetical protein DES38_104230 [Streptohalobacillus salinus]
MSQFFIALTLVLGSLLFITGKKQGLKSLIWIGILLLGLFFIALIQLLLFMFN